MRRTIRHVAVLAAAVVMLTALAVPAGGKGFPAPTIETFDVSCSGPHWVTATATADADRKERALVIELLVWTWYLPHWEIIAQEEDEGTGPLQVQVEGDVTGEGDGYYLVNASLCTLRGSSHCDVEGSYGYC